ncbi:MULTISPECIES: YrhB domain-containing protein [unclassified Flavobacterium]|uniref:YrhB domain-containing protein n=1 Tax=unclassified Flavobacterium TaxID=196869 RepID=UPI001F12D67E|nr:MULTISPECIES: YrhB domain-containing protein [unclassified Flavobacterium]UMY66464.1 YrhB family protein [Flavobacterium sp. HJ-32-4]
MLSEQRMLQIAENYASGLIEKTTIEVVIPEKSIVRKPYGNVYFFTTKKHLDTGDSKYALAGNAPFLVENKTGRIVVLGTAKSEDYYLQEYEAGRWPLK